MLGMKKNFPSIILCHLISTVFRFCDKHLLSEVNMADAPSPSWDIAEVVAERMNIDLKVSANVIDLLEKENTIPFIARYRREQTGMMDVDKLREVHSLLEELR